MVPNGWSLERFDSVAELIHGFQFREHHFSDSGVPVIKIGNISNLNGINIEQCSYIPEAMATEFTKYIVNAGDVLMALTGGTLGKTCRVQDDIVHCLQNYRVGNFKPKAGLLDKGFLYYFLTSSTVQKRIENIVNEAAQPNVGKADFEKIKVLTPPLNEQKKIAKILSTWDKAISTTEQLLANSQQQKKALMQQLLTGKKRLNGYSGAFKRYHFSDILKIDSKSLGTKTDPDFEFDREFNFEVRHSPMPPDGTLRIP
ncbi:restriction endonuclease subunit S [Aeromonas rivipollensis]|uniref:restriction endonuclease subunit S n=1 Tax=Aeromonas rivipollensis TaxID=948519 RepID=UPI003D255198